MRALKRKLNRYADPPIEIVAHYAISDRRPSWYQYIDPEDNAEFDEDDLTPLERGFVFFHSLDPGGDVAIELPYRTYCPELGSVLAEFSSFQCQETWFCSDSPRKSYQYKDRPKALRDKFSLSQREFEIFQERAKSNNWLVSRPHYDDQSLIDGLADWQTRATDCQLEVVELRKNWLVGEHTVDDLREAYRGATEAESLTRTLLLQWAALQRQYSDLRSSMEAVSQPTASVSLAYESAAAVHEQLVRRLASETRQALQGRVNQAANLAVAVLQQDLQTELQILARSFPVLERIRVESNETLVVRLPATGKTAAVLGIASTELRNASLDELRVLMGGKSEDKSVDTDQSRAKAIRRRGGKK